MSDIDPASEKILLVLESEGRLTNIALAEKVGLSPSACLRRVQELERTGVIAGYRAIINRSAIAPRITVFVTVGLAQQLHKDARAFENAMDRAPQVLECHNIAGNVEYLLRVEVGDLAEYKDFHAHKLGQLPQVSSITSHFCLETSKDVRNRLKS
ncbi:Lrp/AsnC family transcriptional regulator [Yoonia sp. SDW83-1]|uniref:Lrp/AsnC family transcriptional regulator n=1 Tax=Yoonia sp. SDW83-1 TaxID=3366945 RepID=UPI00398C3A43